MQHCDSLFHAARILTQDAGRSILDDAALAVRDGLVVAAGPVARVEKEWTPDKRIDLPNMLLMPGLVNAHTHAAMTFLRGLADDMPLMDWLQQRIFPVEQALTPHIVRVGSLLGYAEMLRTGTTACIDMYIFEHAVFEAAHTAGLRCLGGEAVFDFPSACCPTPQAALDATRELAETWRDDPLLRVAVNPHSVYTTSPRTLKACAALAEELHLPLHIHLAETPEETARCLESCRRRPVAHADACGLLRPGAVLAHVVDVNAAEIALLKDRGVRVVHNPSSNMKLASGAAPLPAMLRAGLIAALGTDGAASNNQLNMFTEMGRAALLHKLTERNPTVATAQDVLDMATLGGAAAFGDPRLGRLEPGSAADFIALDLDAPNLRPMYNPVSHAVYAATGAEVRLTVVGGRILYQDGRFPTFDYAALCREADDVRDFVVRKLA